MTSSTTLKSSILHVTRTAVKDVLRQSRQWEVLSMFEGVLLSVRALWERAVLLLVHVRVLRDRPEGDGGA